MDSFSLTVTLRAALHVHPVGKETPKAGAKVSTAQCNTCHQSLDAVAKQTSKLDPNPHYNHLVGLDCAECHRGHQQSVNMCAQCHNIEYKVP